MNGVFHTWEKQRKKLFVIQWIIPLDRLSPNLIAVSAGAAEVICTVFKVECYRS